MAELTYYEVLQVHPEANEEAIRAAYFRLAKLYHPDLRREDQRPEDTEKFIEINRAYTVLADPAKRQLYDLDLASRGQAPAPSAVAAATVEPGEPAKPPAPIRNFAAQSETGRAYIRAEQLVDEGRFRDAARLMQAVVRIENSDPKYLSLAGYALAAAGESLHKARDLCRRAVEAEPYNATYQARLAFVYRAAGLESLAERFYAEALRLDPTQPLARQAAGVRGRPDGGGGLLGALRSRLSR